MVDQVITFFEEGDFKAYYAAKDWCERNGYSHGSMQNRSPIGLLKGNWTIAKWRNLNKEQRDQLHGTMTCVTSFREAPVHIVLKNKEKH